MRARSTPAWPRALECRPAGPLKTSPRARYPSRRDGGHFFVSLDGAHGGGAHVDVKVREAVPTIANPTADDEAIDLGDLIVEGDGLLLDRRRGQHLSLGVCRVYHPIEQRSDMLTTFVDGSATDALARLNTADPTCR